MNTNPIILFCLGILTQAFLLLVGRMNPTDVVVILGCCAFSMFGLMPGKHEYHYNYHEHCLFMAGTFSFAYAFCFKKKLLERINKEVLLIWTLVALYTALQVPFIVSHAILFIPILTLSLIAIANGFAGFDEAYGWQVFFYIWFLIIIVGIVVSQFAFSTVFSVFSMFGQETVEADRFTMFALGMAFLYMMINICYLIQLIPLPSKHQSFDERLAELKADMEMFASDYDVQQVRRWRTLCLFLLATTFLALNYFLRVMNDTVLVCALIAVLPLISRFFPSQSPKAVSVAPEDFAPPA